MIRRIVLTACLCVSGSLAYASPLGDADGLELERSSDGVALQDEEDLLGDEETEEEKKEREEREKNRLESDDSIDLLDDEGEMDKLEDVVPTEENTDDLLESEIGKDVIGGEGEDNSTIYRKAADDYADMIADEEMLAWERYLETYPNSLYKERIEKRMESLEVILYEQVIEKEDPNERLDADQRELLFSQGLTLENINPRTRLQFGFEWGLPDYMNLIGDFEYQIIRVLSVHGAFRNRFTGWNFETGVHWAIVKSSRTQTLLVLLGDIRFNVDPAFLSFRPQLAFGKKFGLLELQAQAGVDLEVRSDAAPRILAGVNGTYNASDKVAIFLETNIHMRLSQYPSSTGDNNNLLYRFNVASFGLKFYPRVTGLEKRAMEVNVGASVPYTTNYWMFHFGSIMGQVNYYM